MMEISVTCQASKKEHWPVAASSEMEVGGSLARPACISTAQGKKE